jgi:PAS domain S-box-containing protein
VRRFDNIYRWFRTTAQPLRDHSGCVIRWYGVAHDIEDWKRAEEGLREREVNSRLVVDSIPGLVNTMTAEGENEFVNQQVLDYFGKSHEELNNWATSDVVHSDDLPRVIAAFASSIETGQPYDTEHRIRRADGVYRCFQVRALPLRNTEGRIVRWYVLSTDIDERKQAEDRLQLLLDVTNKVVSNLQLQDLLRAISASVRRVMHCDLVSVCFPDSELNRLQTFVLDFPESKGFIREEFFTSMGGSLSGFVFRTGKPWTGSALDILQLGLKDEAAIPEGLKTGCILPLVSRNRVLGVLSLGRREENAFSQDDIGFLTQVASQISIAVENVSAYSEIAHARSELEKALGETKQRTEALRRSEGYLAEAQKLSHTGSFGWDISSGEIYWSRETFRIFEYEPTAKVTLELIAQRTHPEDRSAVQQLIEGVSRERTAFDFEHRLLMPDGSVKYLRVVGSPSEEENGCFEFVGAVTDITERKRADDALRRSEGCLAEAQRLTRTGSWAWNLAARHSVYWSQEHYRVFGFDPEGGIPSDEAFHQRIHPEDRDRVRRAVFVGREDEGSVFDVDYRIVLPDGAIKYIRSTGHPVFDASGNIIEYFGAARDMTEQHEARAALETAFEQIKALKDQLYNENIALREEIDRSSMFEEIVGASPALRAVLSRVSKVAPTDSTVLLTGETGTGKELIARAIHKRSRRSSRAFVSVNCAAIPASLIASELFGHEKGAFTGATQRRLGRFELAEEGTLFLDEVGELPAETQITLLRVLQEREFERVGGNQLIRADVRVIAATNRNLEAAIAAGTFRSDLFYRLNVFPIEIPPLRQRREDIPLLVEYFIGHFARKAGKSFRGINKKTLDLLLSYPWPGNIRELQNVVERSVIVCETENFSVDERWLSRQPLPTEPKGTLELSHALAAQEKEMIEAALRESGGRVSGPSGAAAKLGIHRSTLESKIASLKINKYRFKTASSSKNS